MKQRGREGRRAKCSSKPTRSVGRSADAAAFFRISTDDSGRVSSGNGGGRGRGGRKEGGVLGGKARKMMPSLTQVTPLQGSSEEWAPVAVNQRDYISVFFSAESAGKKQFFFSSDSRNLGHILYYPF